MEHCFEKCGIKLMNRKNSTVSVLSFSERAAIDRKAKTETKEVKLTALRGAHICEHVIVRAKDRVVVSAYVTDGVGKTGAVFRAENVDLYAEKSILIDRNWHHNGLPTGEYTDALLPLETAVNYGETETKNGKAVVLAVDFSVPVSLPAGSYTGEIVVSCGEEIRLPYELTVLETVQPESITCKSLFTINPNYMEHYEGSRSQETMDAYILALLEHRAAASGLFATEDYSDEGLRKFSSAAAEWVRRGIPTIGVPAYVKNEEDGEYPDFGVLERAVIALAEESLVSGINLPSYCAFYDWQIDEPFLAKMPDGKVERCVNVFRDTIDGIVKNLSADERFQTPFGKEVVKSIANIPHVVTDYCDRLPEVLHFVDTRQKRDKNGNPYHYPMDKTTLCPKFDGYDNEYLSAPYGENPQKWWYGCNAPSAPYIGYHMDDAPWSARYIGWLMARYGIVGNLYWVVNQGIEINTTGKPLYLDDPYGTAHRGFGANGDGVLLYPGKPYGLKKPVGCIRLKAIREGNADYEWLKILREGYKNKGVSFDSLFDRLTAPFAHGVRIDAFAQGFDRTAESLMRLYDAFLCCGLTAECQEGKGNMLFRFSANRGTKILFDGKTVTGETEIKCRECYIVLSVENGNYKTEIPLWIGGRLTVLLHEELYRNGMVTCITAKIEPLRHDIYRELTISPHTSKTTVQITLPEAVCKGKRRAGLEIRAYRGAVITLNAGGKTVCVRPKDEWVRLDFSLKSNCFTVAFEGDKSIALGALYLH